MCLNILNPVRYVAVKATHRANVVTMLCQSHSNTTKKNMFRSTSLPEAGKHFNIHCTISPGQELYSKNILVV